VNDYIESEKAVIGGLLRIGDLTSDSCQKVLSMVKASSFASRHHQIIFSAIKRFASKAEFVDMISLDSALIKNGQSEETGGIAYIADLEKSANVSALISHAEIVRENAISRVINAKLNDAIAMVNDQDGRSIYEKTGEIESMISAILERSVRNKTTGLVHAAEICEKWTDEMQERFDNPQAQSGYATGIVGLDELLKPKMVRKGSLVVVGARPKMGKTALLGKIFYEGADDQADFSRVSVAMGDYINSKLYMDDTPAITIQHIQRESRKLAKKEPMGLIAIDYLTLMEAERADRNDLAYGKITKALKNLAKELDCVVLLLTQLNRSLESRTNKRPMPSDSRDTGQIEQDCDLWIGLYRESVYNDAVPNEQKGLTELIVRLNRHGDTGTAYLNLVNGYFKEAQKFTFENEYDDDY